MSIRVTISAAAPPASTGEALAMLTSAMRYLAAADATQMPVSEQAECLQALERSDAIETAARASVLAAFTAAQGHCEDGDYSPRSWLIHKTRVTKGVATGHITWVRRARAHPRIAAALAAGELTESYARTLCQWTDKLPEQCRGTADEILAGAARKGMDLRDLAALAAEIQSRATPPPDPDDPDPAFEDRAVRLETTFQGAGVLSGDLSPECTALVNTVLDALSAPRGAEDTRTHEQRYHDGLAEAMRRLVAAGLLPDRAGQPVKVIAHISLADLMVLDGDSALQERWTERVRAQWAAHRAAASVAGSDGAAWLDGDAAEGFACDASITPVVFGNVNPAVLDDLVRLCVQLARFGHGASAFTESAGTPAQTTPDQTTPDQTTLDPAAPEASSPALLSRESLERLIIGKAVALVSGPGGLASFLRREQLGARLAGPSLPLDVGYSDSVPAGIRNAVKVRDMHCQWAGGYFL
ncbi:MAG: DUF222 domain-containing protein [Streptosporangiaceae bacterium]